jgi:hypothetical protein
MLSDDELARQVVLEVDMTYSYAQIPDALRPILEQAIIKAFAAIRDECAKDNVVLRKALEHIVSWYVNGEVGGTFSGCISIAEKALYDTAQPGKAQEGA